MDKAQQLHEMEAVKQVHIRYFRSMDAKRWQDFGELFVADSVVRFVAAGEVGKLRGPALPDQVIRGRDEIVAAYSKTLHDAVTKHHGYLPEVVLTSATTATSLWQVQEHIEAGAGSPLESVDVGYGYHSSQYEKCADGCWRISELDIARSVEDL
jgi:hypothetical protein